MPCGVEKLCIFDVGNVSIAGGIQAADAHNHDRAITRDSATDVRGEIGNRPSFRRHD